MKCGPLSTDWRHIRRTMGVLLRQLGVRDTVWDEHEAIFLGEVNEFNGPLMFILGSHKLGVLDAQHDTATAKGDLKAGEILDGEGGYTVVGKLLPADASLKIGALSLGLAHNVKLLKPIVSGQPIRWTDVKVDETSYAAKVRREMEKLFAPATQNALVQ